MSRAERMSHDRLNRSVHSPASVPAPNGSYAIRPSTVAGSSASSSTAWICRVDRLSACPVTTAT